MKNKLFELSAFACLIAVGCGSGNDVDTEPDLGSDADVYLPDCASQTVEKCGPDEEGGCMVLKANVFDPELDCFAPQESISCTSYAIKFNSETPARHLDGTCALFSSTTLPDDGEWTEDDKCNELLTENGYCG